MGEKSSGFCDRIPTIRPCRGGCQRRHPHIRCGIYRGLCRVVCGLCRRVVSIQECGLGTSAIGALRNWWTGSVGSHGGWWTSSIYWRGWAGTVNRTEGTCMSVHRWRHCARLLGRTARGITKASTRHTMGDFWKKKIFIYSKYRQKKIFLSTRTFLNTNTNKIENFRVNSIFRPPWQAKPTECTFTKSSI